MCQCNPGCPSRLGDVLQQCLSHRTKGYAYVMSQDQMQTKRQQDHIHYPFHLPYGRQVNTKQCDDDGERYEAEGNIRHVLDLSAVVAARISWCSLSRQLDIVLKRQFKVQKLVEMVELLIRVYQSRLKDGGTMYKA